MVNVKNKGEIYKCKICGNIVEVIEAGGGELVCCGQPMILQKEKTQEEGKEKHLPVIERNRIKIGSIEHPMTQEHYIQWIEATDKKQVSKIFLKPGQKPEAEFSFIPISARAYCNIHGLWKS